jgi:tetratricopeptide (TPR) repeat protein
MKAVRAGAVALALIAGGCASPSVQNGIVAIRNVAVLPMTSEQVLEAQTVLVREGIIVELGATAEVEIPRGARIVEGQRLYLMPGLVDGHTHPAGPEELLSFPLFGQTTIFTLDGEALDIARPTPGAFNPHLISSTRSMDAAPSFNRRFQAVAGPEDIAAILDAERARGADFVKVYEQTTLPVLQAIAREAAARNMGVLGHLPNRLDPAEALPHLDIVAHTEEFMDFMGQPPTDAGIIAMADLAQRNDVVVTANLSALAGVVRQVGDLQADFADAEAAFLSPWTYQEWQGPRNRYTNRQNLPVFLQAIQDSRDVLSRFTAELHARDVTLIAGSDAPITCFPGRCLLEEIALLHEAGLSRYEALRAATATPGVVAADVLRFPERFGVIAPGARADIILLGANPLQSLDALQDLRGVMIAGDYRTREQIAAARDGVRASLATRHGLVRDYERLLAANDIAAVAAFMDAHAAEAPFLNASLVTRDAARMQRAGRTADATTLLEALTRLAPETHGAWIELGRVRMAANDAAGARTAFNRALEIAPRDAAALAGLASLP